MKHARADYQGRIVDKAGLIPEDEPVFVLRGQDELAASAVRWYAVLARNNGRDDIADAANRHADEMQKWHPRKLPDLPKAILLSLGVLFFGGDVARARPAMLCITGETTSTTPRGFALRGTRLGVATRTTEPPAATTVPTICPYPRGKSLHCRRSGIVKLNSAAGVNSHARV
jgi:hypothetical protein